MNTQDKNNQAEAEQIFLESCIALTEVAADLVDTVEEQRRIIDLQRELIKTQGELIKRDNALISVLLHGYQRYQPQISV